MSLIQFCRNKCSKCGSKFTISSEHYCTKCKNLGVPCKHKTLCFTCFKDATRNSQIKDKIFFSALIAISLTAYYGIGVKIF